MKSVCLAILGIVLAVSRAGAAEPFSINDALREAAKSHPGVGEAAANRRATESELRQTQSTLLPQVRIEARYGPEKFDQSASVLTGTALPVPIVGNGAWRNGSQESVVVRQILFDGFASIHDIWRQSARVNAAAFRVRERTELITLDAAEAYVDVVRYLRLVALAEQNVATHERIFSNVNSRFSGGRAGEGDLEQARERVENARAALAEFRKSLDDARAKYRKVVGLEPFNLRFPGPLGGMPSNRDESLAVSCLFNTPILFFFQAEDGIRDLIVTGVQTCALPICDDVDQAVQRGHVPLVARGGVLVIGQAGKHRAPRGEGAEAQHHQRSRLEATPIGSE